MNWVGMNIIERLWVVLKGTDCCKSFFFGFASRDFSLFVARGHIAACGSLQSVKENRLWLFGGSAYNCVLVSPYM